MLREVDIRHLEQRGHQFETYEEGNLTLLVIKHYELPAGYAPGTVDLLIQIPRDYPDANLDMWWVYPEVVFARTNAEPVNTQVRQAFPGYTQEPDRQWQRFSRHPQWRPGVDDLRTFLASLRSTMDSEARQIAA